jgi:nucleoside-diphosphate-sugar epimerase
VKLFVFGLGYTALALARLALARGSPSKFSWIGGTVRGSGKADRLASEGIHARCMEPAPDPRIREDVGSADALLVSIPPGEEGDAALASYSDAIAAAPRLGWIGYLSTVGVYGDQGGDWVDEATPPAPSTERSRRRVRAETAWLDLGRSAGKAVHLFRLSGIYGPGRNALANLANGTARRIVKPGQVFNRVHVDDIVAVLMASVAQPRADAIYNVADDEPAPPQDVVAYAARLCGMEPPPETLFDDAALSPMAASFYAENKRVSNGLIREELGVRLRYPTYREGLEALRKSGEGPRSA